MFETGLPFANYLTQLTAFYPFQTFYIAINFTEIGWIIRERITNI